MVTMIIIVMVVLALSIFSMNVSQSLLAESEIKRIQAEILAQGALALTFANQLSNSPGNIITYTQTLGNTVFTVNSVLGPAMSPYNVNSLNIQVSW